MSKHILVIGAGRSATVLIRYLLDQAEQHNTEITVADLQPELAASKVNGHPRGHAIGFSINAPDAAEIIARHDVVISLLPPALHTEVARHCLNSKKHLLTASYLSPELRTMNEEVKKQGLLFMGEMGLDPGIDHMSAMEIIHRIKDEGATIESFKSSTGGLVAPESDDNPWNYKITWNPRNVVMAGQGTAQFIQDGQVKYLPYHRLFTQTEKIKLPGYGRFEAYANRDSLAYESLYGLDGIDTLIRATLRREGYCAAWNILLQLGLTDDQIKIPDASTRSYKEWLKSYLPPSGKKSAEARVAELFRLGDQSPILKKMKWMGLFSNEKIKLNEPTAAQILQQLMEQKWVMKKKDKDMIVMVHDFMIRKKKHKYALRSALVVVGDNSLDTAMAKTVGLPLGVLAMMLVRNECRLTGIHLPVMKEVYKPVLKELTQYRIVFTEKLRTV
jgi:saccharopine dehydrogenase-like NADP-dependent oxidoreductase